LDELGAPHRDDLKLRTVTVKTADGRDEATISGDTASKILGELIRAKSVYEAVPLDAGRLCVQQRLNVAFSDDLRSSVVLARHRSRMVRHHEFLVTPY
jgi:hypothetical protein